MKKHFRWMTSLLVITFLVACSRPQAETNAEATNQLTYSNLTDQSSQQEMQERMQAAGIPDATLDNFWKDVQLFNEAIEEKGLTKNGFTRINSLKPNYDFVEMMELWEDNRPDFLGYNCRISSYDLMKDSLTIGKIDTSRSDYLAFDQYAMESSPRELFSEKEYEEFQTLYGYIPTTDTQDINVHLKNIQKDWQEKEIEFLNEEKSSLISVFFHEEDGYLFIGHMGILFPGEADELLFLEKLSFQEPYQAIKFSNRSELNDYLMNKYDLSWDQPTAAPFILENDQLLEGYRQLPKNNQ